MSFMDILAQILNPNPGTNRLVGGTSPSSANYLAQTGAAPQLSSMGEVVEAPQPVPHGNAVVHPNGRLEEASAGRPISTDSTIRVQPVGYPALAGGGMSSQGGLGGFLSSILGGGRQDPRANQTFSWLMQQPGMDEGTATYLISDRSALQGYIRERINTKPAKRNTTVIDGKLVDADTGELIHDYGNGQKKRNTTVIDGKLVDADTGELITITALARRRKLSSTLEMADYMIPTRKPGSLRRIKRMSHSRAATSKPSRLIGWSRRAA